MTTEAPVDTPAATGPGDGGVTTEVPAEVEVDVIVTTQSAQGDADAEDKVTPAATVADEAGAKRRVKIRISKRL